ncbi:hypothetical protein BKA93DRAFT_121552 [Sparassis latifolia]
MKEVADDTRFAVGSPTPGTGGGLWQGETADASANEVVRKQHQIPVANVAVALDLSTLFECRSIYVRSRSRTFRPCARPAHGVPAQVYSRRMALANITCALDFSTMLALLDDVTPQCRSSTSRYTTSFCFA